MSHKAAATPTKKRREHPFYEDARPTWEVAYFFPAQGHWTEEAYFDLDPLREGSHPLLELSNGRLEVLSMPTELHQMIAGFLYQLLGAFIPTHAPGVVLFAAMKVRLWKRKFREPDLLYMKAENAHRRHQRFWEGADLLMEIVSPDPKDRKRDLVVKPREYARAGIPEYWIVNPIDRWIRVLVLDGKKYKLHGEFGPGEVATSVLLPGFSVAVDAALNPPGSSPAP